MYTITRKVTRPNLSLEFRNMLHESISPEIKKHWVDNYKNTSKCLIVNTELSSNQLEMITTMFWDTKASWDEYQADPVFVNGLFTPIHTYQDENGFTREFVSDEEI
jgi:hypothetical protein